jgi:hypothetical protein
MRLSLVLAAVGLIAFSGTARADYAKTGLSRIVRVEPRPYTETASSGAVVARFRYSYNAKTTTFSKVTLEITRDGVELLNAAVKRPPRNSYAQVWPANGPGKKSVFVRDLDGDGEPEVLLALYWGGAHCCHFSYVYRYLDGSYRRVYHLWGDPSYALRDLNGDGNPEFVSADDRFAYAFTSFADSAFPVQIWRYQAGRFSNVTRAFPALTRIDAARNWGLFGQALGQRRSVYGVLAAWSADQCLLNRCGAAFRRLQALRKAGKLRGGPGDGTPQRYLRHLRGFLTRTGYLRRRLYEGAATPGPAWAASRRAMG